MTSTAVQRILIIFQPRLIGGLCLSLAVGFACYYTATSITEHDNEARFRGMAHNAQATIDARIKSYTDALRASASMFTNSENVTRDEFRRYVEGLDLDQHFPAIETMNFLRWVTDEERDAFEEQIRREDARYEDGRPKFNIIPSGRRPTYSVVVYIEPNPFWKLATGVDLNTQPLVYKALMHSRDTGQITASGAPIKVMQDQKRVGFGMRLPVYRHGAPLRTVEERRAAYVGSVGIAFNAGRLVEDVLNELPVKGVRLSLFNEIQPLTPGGKPKPQLLYDSIATEANPQPKLDSNEGTHFNITLPIDFNGRRWTAHFSAPRRSLYRVSDESFHYIALLAGFASTMLLYSIYYSLTSSRERALELARGMTKELRESQEQLLHSHENLRRLTAHAETAKERERKRIAREIHDDLGQNLLALRIDAQLLSSRTGDRHPRLHARAEATLNHIDTTIKSMRQIINDLRPSVLDLGLNAAVDWQIAEFRRRTGLACELFECHTDTIISDECATALFRILQESLTNIRRHAHASLVRVELRTEADWVRMTVRDNGIGITRSQTAKHGKFGLIGIEERVKMLHGKFLIEGSTGKGTTVQVSLPLGEDGKADDAAQQFTWAHAPCTESAS